MFTDTPSRMCIVCRFYCVLNVRANVFHERIRRAMKIHYPHICSSDISIPRFFIELIQTSEKTAFSTLNRIHILSLVCSFFSLPSKSKLSKPPTRTDLFLYCLVYFQTQHNLGARFESCICIKNRSKKLVGKYENKSECICRDRKQHSSREN